MIEQSVANHPNDRRAVKALIKRWFEGWINGSFQLGDFAAESQFFSSHHGHAKGGDAITKSLLRDTANGPMLGQFSNVYVATLNDKAIASFYLFGLMGTSNANLFLFGSTQVIEFSKVQDSWKIDTIRLVVNWSKGDSSQVSHWRNLPVQNGWQIGFEAPAMISELHSPWAVFPEVLPPEDLQEALEELYFRYAFAVDQNDMMLLKSAYSEDISGGFAPVGNLNGRDQVIGTLKNFRHLATYWQHFAEVVRYEEEPDGQHVKMIVARIIPERPVDESGQKVYGAHYQLRARKTASGQWQFCWTDYRPGWFDQYSLPEFDVGNATA